MLLLISTYHREGMMNWPREVNLSNFTQLVSDRTGIWICLSKFNDCFTLGSRKEVNNVALLKVRNWGTWTLYDFHEGLLIIWVKIVTQTQKYGPPVFNISFSQTGVFAAHFLIFPCCLLSWSSSNTPFCALKACFLYFYSWVFIIFFHIL